MNKTLLLCLTLLLWARMIDAQTVTREERFLNSYETFVNEVVATPIADFHGDTLNHVKKMQRRFMRRYRWCYDTRMSVEQLERFNRLCGRYQHKMKTVTRHRRWVATKGRISGRLEGLFKDRDNPSDTLLMEESVSL